MEVDSNARLKGSSTGSRVQVGLVDVKTKNDLFTVSRIGRPAGSKYIEGSLHEE